MLAFLSSDDIDPIQWIFIHNMDGMKDGISALSISRLTLNMWLAALILGLLMVLAKKDGLVPSGKAPRHLRDDLLLHP